MSNPTTPTNGSASAGAPTPLPEAPASVSFRYLDRRGFEVQLTLRHTDGLTLLKRLDAALDHLLGNGATPITGSRPAVSNGTQAAQVAQGEAPLCPTHNKPMKQSKHGNGWYCPEKVGVHPQTQKPLYCIQKVGG